MYLPEYGDKANIAEIDQNFLSIDNVLGQTFDMISQYLGYTKWTTKISDSEYLEEIRWGTDQTGTLLASRRSVKLVSDGSKVDTTYSFYKDQVLIKQYIEHFEQISGSQSKSYAEATV
jgi:hypothetical protein